MVCEHSSRSFLFIRYNIGVTFYIMNPERFRPEFVETEKQTEVCEVTPKFLREVFGSEDFTAKLSRAALKMIANAQNRQRRYLEVGLAVYRHVGADKPPVIGKVVESPDQLLGLSTNDSVSDKVRHSENYVGFSSLHFHPYEPSALIYGKDVIVPSVGSEHQGDLVSTNAHRYRESTKNARRIVVPAVDMIAMAASKTDPIHVLAYRESLERDPTVIMENIGDDLSDLGRVEGDAQAEVLRILRNNGYMAALLKADLSTGFDEASLQILERFAYVPKYEQE
jgi:hypothetical protein